ncbi:FtsL-like putative cell division protein [Segatella hominis]|uniref:FtsL-like putative cell division protein n=1 Tax=Segatella hominis TaxID=2518605 RepID=UPI003F7DCFFE
MMEDNKEDKSKLEAEEDKSKQELKEDKTKGEPRGENNDKLELKQVIAEQAIEGEAPLSSNFSLRKILGGDILTARIIRRQIWLVILVVFFVIIYISNRYSIQKDLIEIDQLQKELQDAKYKALSSSSQITEKSRESNVLEMLKNNKDSVLHIATQPPYIINVPEQ